MLARADAPERCRLLHEPVDRGLGPAEHRPIVGHDRDVHVYVPIAGVHVRRQHHEARAHVPHDPLDPGRDLGVAARQLAQRGKQPLDRGAAAHLRGILPGERLERFLAQIQGAVELAAEPLRVLLRGGTGTGTFSRTAGTYTFNVTDANGCTASTTITIAQPAVLVASSTATAILCNGGSSTVNVSATGGTAPYTGTGAFTRTAGTYTFTVTDARGCTASTTITITQPTAITASAAAGTINCFGGTTTLTVTASGGTGALQYSLNGGAFQVSNAFIVPAGTYTVTVRDANNCTTATAPVTVTQPTALTVTTTITAATSGSNGTATATPAGGTAPYTYLWTPGGQTTQTATGLAAGVYTVVVTDARGCTATATATVVANGCNLIVNAGPDAVLCNGRTVTLTAAVSGLSAGVTPATPFTEVSGSTAEMRLFSGNIDQITIGNTFSMGEDRNNCGKLTSSSKTLTIPAGAIVKKAYLYWSGSGAQDTKVKLNGTLVTADGTKTATRSGGFSYFAGRKDVTSMVTASGNYTVTELEWNNGSPYCFDNSAYGAWAMTVIYEQPTLPSARIHVNTEKFVFTFPGGTYSTTINNVSVPAGCNADAKLTIVAFEGDNYKKEKLRIAGVLDVSAPVDNNFRGQSGFNLDIVTKNAPSVVAGTTSLTYSIETYAQSTPFGTAVEGLFDYAKVLKYNSCPAPVCSVSYVWKKNGVTVGTTQSINVNSGGTYTVEAKDCANCIATDQVVVTPSTLAAASAAGTIACNGGTTTVTVSATGGTAPYTGTGTFTRGAGTWSFTVTDAKGCTAVTNITIAQPAAIPAPIVGTRTHPTCTVPTGSVVLSGLPATGTWTLTRTPGGVTTTGTGTSSTISGLAPGTYTFKVTNAAGCISPSSANVVINAAPAGQNPCVAACLIASKTYNPSTFYNATVNLCSPATYTVPAFIDVTMGNAGNHWAELQYTTPSGQVITILYQGGSDQAHPSGTTQINLGKKWSKYKGAYLNYNGSIPPNQTATGLQVGQTFQATKVVLKVNGSNQFGKTEGTLILTSAGCPVAKGPQDMIVTKQPTPEVESELKVVVMPNPSSDYFTLIVKSNNLEEPVSVRIMDLNGKMLATYKTGINTNLKVGEARWANGTYFAEVTQGGERKVVRLVKVD